MEKLHIEVWSDIACPWCYVGKRRLETAIRQLGRASDIDVVWRAFELDPTAPAIRDDGQSYAGRLAQKYGTALAQAEAMIESMTNVAAADGLEFRFDRIKPGNTFDAHRVLHLAHDRGLQDAVKERFLRAYMTEGAAIGETATVARLAVEAGLDEHEVGRVLASDAFGREVRADQAKARALGINGVPFFVVASRYGISGAQSAEVLRGVIERASADCTTTLEPNVEEGATCGPDGCV